MINKKAIEKFTLFLFGKKYEVRRNVPTSEIPDADGHIHYANQIIRISDDISTAREREVLIHEIIHKTMDHYQLGDFLKDKQADEEKFVTLLSQGLFQIFEANPSNIKTYAIGPYDEFLEDNK